MEVPQDMHDSIKLIHTDLKPENILLESCNITLKDRPDYYDDSLEGEDAYINASRSGSRTISNTHDSTSRSRSSSAHSRRDRISSSPYRVPESSKIQVIDMGSAIFSDDHHSSVISTRHYRAPEVILRLGWSFPADIWSVGCILLELYTGDTTFQTHQNLEHLAMMEAVLGPFPQEIISEKTEKQYYDYDGYQVNEPVPLNSTVKKYFKPIFVKNRNSRERDCEEGKFLLCVDWPDRSTSSRSRRRVRSLSNLREIIDTKAHGDFYDLVSKMLTYDPEKRITAKRALKHSFFKTVKPSK